MNRKYKFSNSEINRINRLCESAEEVKEEVKKEQKPAEIDKKTATDLLEKGSYIDFKMIPENKRKNILDSFKKAGLKLQKTTCKSIAKLLPAIGQAYSKNSEKVNSILALGIAAGVLCEYGISIDTCCASAGIMFSPKMIEILKDLATDFSFDD